MEGLILKFITDRFGKYKTMAQNNYLVLHNDGYVVGVLIYDRKQFNYLQHIQNLIMDMFNLTLDEVNWYMKRWVAHTLNEDVLETDGVFGHE
jgi:hypothetical protein